MPPKSPPARTSQGLAAADQLNDRAVALFQKSHLDAAIALWKDALEHFPHHPEAVYNLGLAQWRNARADDAALIRDLREAVEANHPDWTSSYLLGLAHLERDDCQGAASALQAAATGGAVGQALEEALDFARTRLPESRRLLHSFGESGTPVNALALAGDARTAVSGGDDGILRLWSLPKGECDRMLQAHHGSVLTVSVDGANRLILSAGTDLTLKLWDHGSGQLLRTLTGHGDLVASAVLSGDGRHALSGSDDRTMRLWERRNRRVPAHPEGPRPRGHSRASVS